MQKRDLFNRNDIVFTETGSNLDEKVTRLPQRYLRTHISDKNAHVVHPTLPNQYSTGCAEALLKSSTVSSRASFVREKTTAMYDYYR